MTKAILDRVVQGGGMGKHVPIPHKSTAAWEVLHPAYIEFAPEMQRVAALPATATDTHVSRTAIHVHHTRATFMSTIRHTYLHAHRPTCHTYIHMQTRVGQYRGYYAGVLQDRIVHDTPSGQAIFVRFDDGEVKCVPLAYVLHLPNWFSTRMTLPEFRELNTLKLRERALQLRAGATGLRQQALALTLVAARRPLSHQPIRRPHRRPSARVMRTPFS